MKNTVALQEPVTLCYNVKKYIYGHEPYCVNLNYPDLNNGLFSVYELYAMRSEASFVEYWNVAFPSRPIDLSQAEKILSITGGVGRYIHNYADFSDTTLNYNYQDILMDDQLLKVAMTLYDGVIPVESMTDFATIDKWDEWIDGMLFYCDGTSISYLTEMVREMVGKILSSKEDVKMANVFRQQRVGFVGDSSGHSSEEFLCQYMASELFSLRPNCDTLKMVYSNTSPLTWTNIKTGQVVTSENGIAGLLNLCCGCFIKWNVYGHETGLDRIWLDFHPPSTICISGMQLKTGKDNHSVTAGVIETQRAYEHASWCNDTTIAGIMSKCERGLKVIITALETVYPSPGYKITVDSFYICTNKAARVGFHSYFQEKNKEVMKGRHCLPSEAFWNDRELTHIHCHLYDGMEWIKQVLPHKLFKLI